MKYSKIMSMTNLGGKIRRLSEDRVNTFKEISLWVTEKIHGENFRVGMDENNKVFIGQRNMTYFMEYDNNNERVFYSDDEEKKQHPRWNAFSHQLKYDIQKIIEFLEEKGESIIFYGELFGNGLQKGFSFDLEGMHVLWFEIKRGNKYLLPMDSYDIFNRLKLKIVPSIGKMSLQEFIDYDVESIKSQIAKEDYVEGIVGVPFNGEPEWWNFSDRCIMKNKIKKYAENQKVKKKKKRRYNSPYIKFVNLIRMEHVVAELEESGFIVTSDKECRQKIVESLLENICVEENEGLEFSSQDRKAIIQEGHRVFSLFLERQTLLTEFLDI